MSDVQSSESGSKPTPRRTARKDSGENAISRAVEFVKESISELRRVADDQGRAAAIKVADGSKRALSTLIAAVLQAWGADSEQLAGLPYGQVLGGGASVGLLRLSPEATAYIC